MLDFLEDAFSSETEREKVDLQNFDEWLERKIRESEEIPWGDASSRYGDIEEVLEELERNLEDLKDKEIPEEVDSRLKKAGKSNKEVLVSRLQGFINNFKTPADGNLETAIDFVERKSEELENLSEKLQSNFMFLQKVHEEESGALLDSIRDLESELSTERKTSKIKESKEEYSKLISLIDKVSETEREVEKLKEDLEREKKRKEELKEKLKEIEEGEATQKIKKVKGELKEIEEERDRIKSEIIQKISPLRRGLKKLNYLGSVPKGEKGLLKKYIDSPFDAVLKDEEISFLEEVLNRLEEGLDEQNLDFSSEERRKVKRDLRKVQIQEIADLKSKWNSLKDEKEGLRSKIEELKTEEEKNKIESRIRKKSEKIKKLTKRIDGKIKNVEDMEEKIEERRRGLEEKTHDLLEIELNLLREGT